MPLYLGLMCGTSMDAIDAALVRVEGQSVEVVATHEEPLPPELQAGLSAFVTGRQREVDTLWRLDVSVAEAFSKAALALLDSSQTDVRKVRAIGSHGQTVHHAPRDEIPHTVQIGDPSVIAQRTGLTTVADFRRRDVAAGGEGAPLAPAFHRVLFPAGVSCAVLNLGGIANLTVLEADEGAPVLGFDTGPANGLMDRWHELHRGAPFDAGGEWARGGVVHLGLLELLLADPYFAAPAPKSTGREYFHLPWLNDALSRLGEPVEPIHVQRTLCELTAATVADCLKRYGPRVPEVLVCGGGAHNTFLMERLSALMDPTRVRSTADVGVNPDSVEAALFAWLAHCTLEGIPLNLKSVTGSREPIILGGIYPGKWGLRGVE